MIFRGVGMEQTTSRGNNVHKAAIAPVSLTEAIMELCIAEVGRMSVVVLYLFALFINSLFFVVYVRMHHPHLINQ